MRDVKLVTLSEDGSYLILSHEGTGEQFALTVDDRVRAAVVSDRARLGQLQLEIESRLRPREIQARVRAGESTELIAEAAGVPLERVLRYGGPVLAEREHVVDQARRCAVRRHGSEGPGELLDEAVDARLRERGADREAVSWDGWRGESGKWAISVHYTVAGRQHRAVFSFDPTGRLVVPTDEPARWLAGEQTVLERIPEDRPTRRSTGRGPEPADEADLAGAGEQPAPGQRFRLAAVPPPPDEIEEETGSGDQAAEYGRASEDRGAVGHLDTIAEEPADNDTEEGTDHDHSEDTLDLTDLIHGERAEAGDEDAATTGGSNDQHVGVSSRRSARPAEAAPATRLTAEPPKPSATSAPTPTTNTATTGAATTNTTATGAGTTGPTSASPAAAESRSTPEPAEVAVEGTDDSTGQDAQASGDAASRPRGNRQRAKRSRSKRAVVPSWDEILFGAGGNGGSAE